MTTKPFRPDALDLALLGRISSPPAEMTSALQWRKDEISRANRLVRQGLLARLEHVASVGRAKVHYWHYRRTEAGDAAVAKAAIEPSA